MHVLYIHQHFTTPQGSGGTRSYELALRLVEAGHKVTIVCGSYGGGRTGLTMPFIGARREGEVDGIRVIEYDLAYSNSDGFRKRARTFVRFALRSTALALTSKYDLIFATTTPLTAGIPGIATKWIRQKPFVFEVRDLWPELPKAMGVITNPLALSVMSLLEWISYRSADRLVALSPGIADGIRKRGIDESRINMVPNGCDIALFAQGVDQPWRPDGIGANDLMAVFTGTHGPANGLDAILDAARTLKIRNIDGIKIALVGQGNQKHRLMERARSESLDNVIFHDPVPKNKLAGLIASADLGIQCLANVPAFYYGTSPNKFFDYISAGLPVINNYPGWVSELIQLHACGYVVPPENPEAFANALVKASENRDLLKKMGDNALELARSDFDRNLLGERWLDWVTGVKAA